MDNTPSAKKSLIRYFSLLLLVTLICFLAYGIYSIWTFEQQLVSSNQASLNVYFDNLISELDEMTAFNQNINANDIDFINLATKGERLPDSEKILLIHDLRKATANKVPDVGAIFVFDTDEEVYFYNFGSKFQGGFFTFEMVGLMSQIKDEVTAADSQSTMRWQVISPSQGVLLFNAYQLHDTFVCSILDLDAFISANTTKTDNIDYVFHTKERILTAIGADPSKNISIAQLNEPDTNRYSNFIKGYTIQSVYHEQYGIGMSAITYLSDVWGFIRVSVLILLAIIALLFVLFMVIYQFMNRVLIYPLNQITNASLILSGKGIEEISPASKNDLLEFATIRNALNQLVVQKVNLEQDNISKTREKEHALLQYYQLQTKSHFFLNCLKSLFNMLQRGEVERMRLMILAFSNHLRYIFHDTLVLVPLKSELDEAQDYYRIIQMDRANPLLLDIDVDESLLDQRVPPLVIQTFLENSYKYNPPNQKVLRFHVQIDRIEMEKKEFIRLRLCDNGIGYTKESLKKLSMPDEQFEQDHVGISNIKNRMSLIYQDNFEIAFYNGADGGACSLIYIPMTEES